MLRITIEINGGEPTVTTQGGTLPVASPQPGEVVGVTAPSGAVAIGAQNAGSAPTGPGPSVETAPLPFVASVEDAPVAVADATSAGAAPEAVLEPPPVVATEGEAG